MSLTGFLKLIILVVSLRKNLAQNDAPNLYKVIGENNSVGGGWSLLPSDHPLLSDSNFLSHIGDCRDCRVIVKTEDISVEVKGDTSAWAGEDLELSCTIGGEDVGLLYPPVDAEVRTQSNTDGEILNGILKVWIPPFMRKNKYASFSVTSKCYLKSIATGEPIDVPSHSLTTIIKYASQVEIEGPSVIDSDVEVIFGCSTRSTDLELKIDWKVTGNGIIEKTVRQMTESIDGSSLNLITSQLSFKRQPGYGETQVNVLCLVADIGMENHAQKIVKDIRENEFERVIHEEIWDIVERNSSDDEFEIPEEFEFVDINENNFRNFMSKIQHLLTEEIGEKMGHGLVGFIKSLGSSSSSKIKEGYKVNQTLELDSRPVSCDPDQQEHGCCPDLLHPAHGDLGLGCCAATEFGCCPDNISPAPAPFFDGCTCATSEFGCCPDDLSPARGPAYEGCGCQYTEHGCCPDQRTPATHEGCSCDTHEHGCCPDGQTPAQGPNMEGCKTCDHYEFGCCDDGLTAASGPDGEGCGCESSRYGCCLDGSLATGDDFMGCPEVPGGNCGLEAVTGPCTEYTDKWFYDMNYGGCARFWYGGCEAGRNHYETEEECQADCVSPRGSAVCFLPPVRGPCQGHYKEWYYDSSSKLCREFDYGGCLGNGNRFLARVECESVCVARAEVPVCGKPVAEGACSGDHTRWGYDKEAGTCGQFSYSGCGGNNNRFMSQEECSATCAHAAIRRTTDLTCTHFLDEGNCEDGPNSTLARWGYHPYSRRCVPFYYTGCGGNDNNFQSLAECESICPTTFSPVISFEDGNRIFINRNLTEARISVSVRALPEPTIQWVQNGRNISKYESQFDVLDDYSLIIRNPTDYNAGNYTLIASNGIGKPISSSTNVIIYPIFPSITMESERSIYKPGTGVTILCKVKVYPTTGIKWFKKFYRQTQTEILDSDSRLRIENYQKSQTELVSRLVIPDVEEKDTGTYSCQVGQALKQFAISVQYGPGERCLDQPSFSLCPLVVRNRFCRSKYYAKFCCRSCTLADQIPGGK